MADKKEAETYKITRASVKYAKVHRPGKAYDSSHPDEWSINAYVTPEDREALMARGVNPKTDKDGAEYYNIKRSVKTKAGADAKAPDVVDHAKKPFTEDIGNGSICNIAVTLFPWTKGPKSGVKLYLNAVQVIKHVAYQTSGADSFQEEEPEVEEF